MHYKLTDWEQRSMENIIAQIAKQHGVTEAEVRRDITELIVESIKVAENDPVARELWKSCPCAGDIPTPEEFIFWNSCRVWSKTEQEPKAAPQINAK